MGNIYLIIFSFLLSLIVGVIGYWLKSAHNEFKTLIRHLTNYTAQLKELIVGIQTQLEKGVEADIKEMKTEIKELQQKTANNATGITALNQQVSA